MKIEKAIELLQNEVNHGFRCGYEDLTTAQKLAVEALKRELLFRERVPKKDWGLLPGETLENGQNEIFIKGSLKGRSPFKT